jgi:hypothetical protein
MALQRMYLIPPELWEKTEKSSTNTNTTATIRKEDIKQ